MTVAKGGWAKVPWSGLLLAKSVDRSLTVFVLALGRVSPLASSYPEYSTNMLRQLSEIFSVRTRSREKNPTS